MIRFIRLLVAYLLLASYAFAGVNGQALSVNGALGTAGQLLGAQTNSNANAGNVGQFLSAFVASPGSAITSATAADITSVTLTPGDWRCYGNIAYQANATTTTTQLTGWVSTTSATNPGNTNNGGYTFLQATFPTNAGSILPVGDRKFTVAVDTIVYLSISATFAVSTATAYGFLGCRRAR